MIDDTIQAAIATQDAQDYYDDDTSDDTDDTDENGDPIQIEGDEIPDDGQDEQSDDL